jgi:putative peptide zinc metalloprotease protein
MTRPIFSAAWYRVATLTPRIRTNALIARHQYRGETWYVLRDVASNRVYRFSPASYSVIGLMDGRRTVQDLWDLAVAQLGDAAPTQDELILLLSQLHSADVLQCEVPPDTAELLRRGQQMSRRQLMSQWLSPLSWRFHLLDPEPMLRRLLPMFRGLFRPWGLVPWLAIVVPALVLMAVHWEALTENLIDRVTTPENALALFLLFPIVKTLHELGHAAAIKAYGGEVHDMGVMLLVFTPIPYVDASSSTAFGSKWRRFVVGGAGMMVELVIASLAMYVWLAAQPGVARSLAHYAIILAGISTVLFNGNPLLRYDGYYMLTDLLEIPNLYTRSRAWLGWAAERYLFGVAEAEPPQATPGERVWFVVYAVASFLYRILVVVAIAFFLLDRVFYIAVGLLILTLGMWVVVPVAKGVRYLAASPRLRRTRIRASGITAGAAVATVVLLAVVPMPHRTRAEGVVWVPEEALVRPETEGFIDRLVAGPGSRVNVGDVLVVLGNTELASREAVLEARVRELRARYHAEKPNDEVRAQIVAEELQYSLEELTRIRQRLAGLVLRASTEGTFIIPQPESLPGRFVKKGDLLAYVLDLQRVTVRAVVGQASIDLVRHHRNGIEVRLAERLDDPRPATLKREVPGAREQLPSPALGSAGGGTIVTDPRDPQGVTALGKVFQVDLDVPSASGLVDVGGRVYVRFDHGWTPLANQWYLELRQLFLARFDV